MVRRNNNVEMRTDTDITIIAGGAITNFVAHSDCIPANTDKSSLREIRDVIRLEQRTELKTVWRGGGLQNWGNIVPFCTKQKMCNRNSYVMPACSRFSD